MRHLVLITKSDCSLCDHAKEVLAKLSTEYQLQVEEVSAETPEGQRLASAAGIIFPPGLIIDGTPFSYGRLSEGKLRRELAQAV